MIQLHVNKYSVNITGTCNLNFGVSALFITHYFSPSQKAHPNGFVFLLLRSSWKLTSLDELKVSTLFFHPRLVALSVWRSGKFLQQGIKERSKILTKPHS
jgi:hypothetical protein